MGEVRKLPDNVLKGASTCQILYQKQKVMAIHKILGSLNLLSYKAKNLYSFFKEAS